MRQVDFTPLYRSTVGFDRLFNMFDTLSQPEGVQTYPPYNIGRLSESSYRISMAVAGFAVDELDIEVHRNQLTVRANKSQENDESENEFLYRGIATRAFERRFQLADYMEVVGAVLKNGLLHIELKREVPEEMKPRRINIQVANKHDMNVEAKKTSKKAIDKTIDIEAAE